jgi:exopolysaccharide biosynthesis polyprenyl glycosylphosphotransferase
VTYSKTSPVAAAAGSGSSPVEFADDPTRQFRLESRGRSLRGDTATAIAVVGDVAMIFAGLFFGFWLRFQSGLIPRRTSWWNRVDFGPVLLENYLGLILIGAVFLFGTFLYLDLYQRRHLLRYRRVAIIIARGTLFWFVAYLSMSLVLRFNPPISRVYVLCSFVGTTCALLAWRAIFHRLMQVEKLARSLRQKVLFVGWSEDANKLTHVIHADESQPYQIVGYLPSVNEAGIPPSGKAIPAVGQYNQLSAMIRSFSVDIVVLTDLNTSTEQIISLANLCEREMVQFKIIPSYFQILVSGLQLETISGVPILGVTELPLDRTWNRFMKRAVDIIGATVGLLGSLPILVWCGLRIYNESPGPILFSQERVGRRGHIFKMLKLRSMQLGAEKSDHLNQSTMRQDPRVLRVGEQMRRWNLDEIPQFWNVLKGEMSLVGPRPERTYHSEKLSYEVPHYNARLASKPGMTGWAQVNGLRGDTDLAERVRYDLYYLENWSLILDFQIMVQTFLDRKNAY